VSSKKIIKSVFIVIAIVSGFIIAGNIYNSNYYTDTRIYERTWDIKLPSNMKLIYSTKTKESFSGDGYRFTVYRLNNSDDPFLSDAIVKDNDALQNKITSILSLLGAEKEQYPNFSHKCLWIILSRHPVPDNMGEKVGDINGFFDYLYIIFDKELSQVYFLQEHI
jgi:hypothetical protein